MRVSIGATTINNSQGGVILGTVDGIRGNLLVGNVFIDNRFGGSIIALCPDNAAKVVKAIEDAGYQARTWRELFETVEPRLHRGFAVAERGR